MASKIKWPAEFNGGILWCPACALEIMRIPSGETRTVDEQLEAKVAHDLVCVAQKIKLVEP